MTGGTTPILWIEEYVGERSLTILSGGARHDSNSNGGEKSPNRSKARRNRIFSCENNLPRAFSHDEDVAEALSWWILLLLRWLVL
jgi:hypothetical protein